jgi:aspartate/methionine/tyrosine aminotransferase
LPRREENHFLPDPAEFRSLLTGKTRLVVLTNLHNPTMALMPPPLVRELIGMAAEVGAWVLVDEIYLDHVNPGTTDDTCFHYGRNVIVTSSLTKVYGVGVLRCGWVLAPTELASRLLEIIDLTTVIQPGIAQNLGARMLMNAARLRPRARMRHERGMPILRAWARARGDVEVFNAPGGITAAVKVHGLTDSEALCEFLVRRHSVLVAPGSAFQMPGWLRINIAGEPEWLSKALAALGQGLDDWFANGSQPGRGIIP